jgi:hypothetical protein
MDQALCALSQLLADLENAADDDMESGAMLAILDEIDGETRRIRGLVTGG